ncbi:MAG: sporulation protein YabP [Eubacterium sp.]|nr:sporulation protein YabP [Eubacterium sp.]MBR1531882.1 sporulation protein YabP [Eubacterium sp.]
MSDEFNRKKHTLFMTNREGAEISGVTDIDSFNGEEIRAFSDYGELMIRGESLQVEALDLETGILNISGNISALVYTDKKPAKTFFGRLFS